MCYIVFFFTVSACLQTHLTKVDNNITMNVITLVFLQKVIKKTTDKIRDSARKSIRTIKTIRGQPATREQIEQAVREANEERCKRNEAREKRRLEASNNNGKRNEQKS